MTTLTMNLNAMKSRKLWSRFSTKAKKNFLTLVGMFFVTIKITMELSHTRSSYFQYYSDKLLRWASLRRNGNPETPPSRFVQKRKPENNEPIGIQENSKILLTFYSDNPRVRRTRSHIFWCRPKPRRLDHLSWILCSTSWIFWRSELGGKGNNHGIC